VVACPLPVVLDSDGLESLDEPDELSSSEVVLDVELSSVVALDDDVLPAVVLLRLSAVASRATSANPAVAATAETASPAVTAFARRLPSSRLVITSSSSRDRWMSLRW
jgi:hypothetical protein